MLLSYPLDLRRGIEDVGLVRGDNVEGKLVLRDGEEQNMKQRLCEAQMRKTVERPTTTYIWKQNEILLVCIYISHICIHVQ